MILCVTRCEAFHLVGYIKVTYHFRVDVVVILAKVLPCRSAGIRQDYASILPD